MKSVNSTVEDINRLCQRLGYTFDRTNLLAEAFRHASYVNERSEPGEKDNERLEFLGDAVLDLAISHILMEFFQDVNEGDLSKYRAAVVDEKGLCQVAEGLGLGDFIFLGKGEEQTNGRRKPSILANTMEALLGALYLDAGFARTKDIILSLFLPLIRETDSHKAKGDYKSLLQEHTQAVHKTRPDYLITGESGPAHDKTFKVAILLNG
ncbi:MAG: ribonuclease III, partial [Deltaproteobacteria bacterium]|nr:ribonuclease III [Deltaproteobacteria bacterium]